MTTQTWTTVLDQNSDAAFRTWGAEWNTKMAACGMVQTADTGQINWTTAVRAAVGLAAGYEIWRYADSSLYLKLEYGSNAGGTNIPSIWRTTGTGSNGSGTITGQTDTRNPFTHSNTPVSVGTARTSWMCHVADAFSVAWKQDSSAANLNQAYLAHGKTVDGSGVATVQGFGSIRTNGSANLNLQCVKISATAVTYSDQATGYCAIPGLPTASDVGANKQAYTVWGGFPDALPFIWSNAVVLAEAPRGNTFTVAMAGTTTRTYLSVGPCANTSLSGFSNATYGPAMIYE